MKEKEDRLRCLSRRSSYHQSLCSSLLCTYHRLFAITSLAFVTTAVLTRTASASGLLTADYCSSEKFVIDCGRDQQIPKVILIKSALYGRMSPGKCVTSTYEESMGCRAEVTSQVEGRCSGRRNCSMLVATFDSIIQPCPRDFKSYLQLTYECVPALFLADCRSTSALVQSSQLDVQSQQQIHYPSLTSPRHGYLALYDLPLTGTGPPTSPALQSATGSSSSSSWKSYRNCVWTLVAEPGQHITISWRLSSAGSWRPTGPDSRHGGQVQVHSPVHHRKPGPPCTVTIVFVDSGLSMAADHQSGRSGRQPEAVTTVFRNTAIPASSSGGASVTSGRFNDVIEPPIHVTTCSTGSRDEPRMIYASKHRMLQIRPTDAMLARLGTSTIDIDDANWKPHLLEYHIIGCSDIQQPDWVVVQRHGNEATISCRHASGTGSSVRRWNVTCRDDQWYDVASGDVMSVIWSAENCTQTPQTSSTGGVEQSKISATSFNVSSTDLNNSLVLAAAVGIALGAVTGATLMIAVLIIKRSRADVTSEADESQQCDDVTRFGLVRHRTNKCRLCCCRWLCRRSADITRCRSANGLGGASSTLYEYTYACGNATAPNSAGRIPTSTGTPRQHPQHHHHHHQHQQQPQPDRSFRCVMSSTVADKPPNLSESEERTEMVTKLYDVTSGAYSVASGRQGGSGVDGGCMACQTLSRLARLQTRNEIYSQQKFPTTASTAVPVASPEVGWVITPASCHVCTTGNCSAGGRRHVCAKAPDTSGGEVPSRRSQVYEARDEHGEPVFKSQDLPLLPSENLVASDNRGTSAQASS